MLFKFFTSVLIVITFLTWIPSSVSGGKILFLLPVSSKSMANIFEPLARQLAVRGHHLTVISPAKFKMQTENVTQLVPFSVEDLVKDHPYDPFEVRKQNKLFSLPLSFMNKSCHVLYRNEEFRSVMNDKYDLIVINILYHDCFAGLVHKIGSPLIQVGSLPVPSFFSSLLGSHLPSSYVPICMLGDISEHLSFIQRLKNFLYNVYFGYMLESTRSPLEDIYREYLGQETPSINDIYRNQTSLILTNSHFALTRPRPLLPSIIEVGGIHCQPAKPLPKDLEEFVGGAEHGFILFSMGSIVRASQMPESVRVAFVRAFGKLKQRVIWKWDKEESMVDLPSNVKLVKWLPQQDLLGHPNIKLFITHGGLLSTEEAVYHGVPVLGMPLFVDQDANMRQAEILGFGVKGEILDLNESKLSPLIERILNEPRYMEQAKKLSKIFRDQTQTPLERAVFWTEYVLRHKGAYHLRSAGMDLNMFQYHSIDVILFLAVAAISAILFIYYLLKLVVRIIIHLSSPLLGKAGKKNKVE